MHGLTRAMIDVGVVMLLFVVLGVLLYLTRYRPPPR